eukprot:SAG22_NODE_8367_length_661_cov_1.030249_1_plen_118_part_10
MDGDNERKSRQRASKAIRSARALVPRSHEERTVLELTSAIRAGGSVDMGEKALLHFCKMDGADRNGVPFHEKVRALCEAGIAVDTSDAWGNTALILASMYNSVETVKVLLDCKANPNA